VLGRERLQIGKHYALANGPGEQIDDVRLRPRDLFGEINARGADLWRADVRADRDEIGRGRRYRRRLLDIRLIQQIERSRWRATAYAAAGKHVVWHDRDQLDQGAKGAAQNGMTTFMGSAAARQLGTASGLHRRIDFIELISAHHKNSNGPARQRIKRTGPRSTDEPSPRQKDKTRRTWAGPTGR
jgi:hypothetical protein